MRSAVLIELGHGGSTVGLTDVDKADLTVTGNADIEAGERCRQTTDRHPRQPRASHRRS